MCCLSSWIEKLTPVFSFLPAGPELATDSGNSLLISFEIFRTNFAIFYVMILRLFLPYHRKSRLCFSSGTTAANLLRPFATSMLITLSKDWITSKNFWIFALLLFDNKNVIRVYLKIKTKGIMMSFCNRNRLTNIG